MVVPQTLWSLQKISGTLQPSKSQLLMQSPPGSLAISFKPPFSHFGSSSESCAIPKCSFCAFHNVFPGSCHLLSPEGHPEPFSSWLILYVALQAPWSWDCPGTSLASTWIVCVSFQVLNLHSPRPLCLCSFLGLQRWSFNGLKAPERAWGQTGQGVVWVPHPPSPLPAPCGCVNKVGIFA